MLGAYPLATRPLATLQEVAGPTGESLWINTRLELDGAAESGIVQNFWGAGAISLFGHVYDPIALPPAYVDSTIQQPTPSALVSPVHQTYTDATIIIDPSGDALVAPDHVIRSTALYEYEPYLEDHYIQTDAVPDFMWSPNGASGVEAVTGKYTVFIKLLQFDPRDTNYWRFIHLYDDMPTNEQQVTDYIVQHYTFFDRVIFGGNTTTGAANWQYQMAAATSAKDQGIQVLAITVNQSTNKARSMIAAGGSTLLNAEAGFTVDRQPLHVAINALVRNISGVHTSQGQNARFKFIAAGVLSDVASSAELASYSTVGDARRVWGTKLYSYWTATSMYDNASPKLKNLGYTRTEPMYLSSLGFSQLYPLPTSNRAAASGTMLNTTNEQVSTPIDADVLVEITVTAVELFIEAHMPLVPEGDALISPIHSTLSDYTIDQEQSATLGQLVSSFEAVRTSVDPDAFNPVLSATSVNATTPVDPDVTAGVVTSTTTAAHTPVDPDVTSTSNYASTPAALVITDADVISLSEYGAVTDARLIAFAKGLAGIDVSSSETAQAHVDADVSVIVNVTATDLDIEAHIPTVTDDVFLVEENNAQWASVRTPVDADVSVIVNVTATDLDIEAHIPTVTDDVFLIETNNTASSQATAAVYNSSLSGVTDGVSTVVRAPVEPDVSTGIANASEVASLVTTQAEAKAGLSLTSYQASTYEYEGGVEQHYLQTISSSFMWSPNAAAGIETVNGTYTLFVKVMQLYPDGSWPFAAGGCLISTYDDTATHPLQTIDAISGSNYYEDVIEFVGYTSYNSINYFAQSQYYWQTTPFVAAITVDTLSSTVSYRAFHKAYAAPFGYTDSLSELRPPLHVSLNAYGLNFGAFHAGISGGANMQFVAAGLIAGSVTDQQIQDYTYARDARGIFGNDMRSYWVASTLEGDENIDPFKSLPDLVGNYPMIVNGNILRSGMYPIPKPNQFTAEAGIADYLSSQGMVGVNFDSTTLAGIISGTSSAAELLIEGFSFFGIVYPPVNIYVSTKVTVEPDAYIAFAVKCVKAYLTNEPGTQATLVDSAGTEALFVNEPGTIAVLIKCR